MERKEDVAEKAMRVWAENEPYNFIFAVGNKEQSICGRYRVFVFCTSFCRTRKHINTGFTAD